MASPASDPVRTALAVLDLARAGRFGEIRDRFAAPLLPLVNADALAGAWSAAIRQIGEITAVGTPVAEAMQGSTVVKTPLAGERGGLTFVVGITASGELNGLQLLPADAMAPVPAWSPPGYVDRDRFDERELTLGPDGLEVQATLSVPKDGNALPAVVLLPGSGPMDRDETVGPSKPFRDLAWGLASRGIVVLRFDKVTHAHGAAARANPTFSMTDEYVPHALAAIEVLRGERSVDPRRIVVAGHSLGGTVAPRVAAASGDVAGLVILAGGAAPLHWVIVRQVRYIASLDPSTAGAAQPGIDALTRQAERVDRPDLALDTPPGELPLGTQASYWLDLRDWNAPAAAAALGLPVLVLQGERDYQATVDDDLPLWRAALGDLPGTTIRVLPGLDHFFFAGSGPSTPQQAMAPDQHMDPAVIDAVADWLQQVPPR